MYDYDYICIYCMYMHYCIAGNFRYVRGRGVDVVPRILKSAKILVHSVNMSTTTRIHASAKFKAAKYLRNRKAYHKPQNFTPAIRYTLIPTHEHWM